MTGPVQDKSQVGLTKVGDEAIDEIMGRGLFAQRLDAYKFGAAYAMATGLGVDDAPTGGYETRFSVNGSLDTDGQLKTLLVISGVHYGDRPYACIEKLAEAGLTRIAERLRSDENLAEIIRAAMGGD